MKKIELSTSKLKLQKEKVTDLINPAMQRNASEPTVALPTTTVYDHTRIPVLCA
jgi:hypothetical protein